MSLKIEISQILIKYFPILVSTFVLKCEMIIASRTFLPTYTLQTDKYKVIRRRLLYLKLTIGLVVT